MKEIVYIWVVIKKMSTRGNSKTPMKLISNAFTTKSYIDVFVNEKNAFVTKTNISISGASTNRWKDNEEFYYWPQYRLCGTNPLDFITYAYLNGVKITGMDDNKQTSVQRSLSDEKESKKQNKKNEGKTMTIGPLICKDPDSTTAKPATCSVTVRFNRKSVEMAEKGGAPAVTDDVIPEYSVKFSTQDDMEKLSSKVKSDKTRNPASYIAHEKKLRSAAKKEKDATVRKSANLDELASRILKHGVPGKSGKSAKSGRSKKSAVTVESFLEKMEEGFGNNNAVLKEKHDVKEMRYVISKLDNRYAGGRTMLRSKLPKSSIHDPKDKRIVFTPESGQEANGVRSGPFYYYKLLADGDEDRAIKMLDKAIAANKMVFSEEERKAPKSSDKSKKSKSKKSSKSKKEETESEEEESESEES
jgi:hypothetical protein